MELDCCALINDFGIKITINYNTSVYDSFDYLLSINTKLQIIWTVQIDADFCFLFAQFNFQHVAYVFFQTHDTFATLDQKHIFIYFYIYSRWIRQCKFNLLHKFICEIQMRWSNNICNCTWICSPNRLASTTHY